MRSASLSPESREARDLIAYLHRSRDEMEEIKRQSREELAQLESERRSLRGEWVDRQKKRIAELERNFQETVKRLEGEVARVTADVHDRVLQAQLEKQSGKRVAKFAADARADTNAAVVETPGVVANRLRRFSRGSAKTHRGGSACYRHAHQREKFQAADCLPAAGRADGGSGSGAAAHAHPPKRYHRHIGRKT